MKESILRLIGLAALLTLAGLSGCGDTYPLGAAFAPCNKDADCPGGACNVYTGQCEASEMKSIYCRSDNDCNRQAGEICFYLTGTCRVACNSNTQCNPWEYCDVVTGICRPRSGDGSQEGDGDIFDPCTTSDQCNKGLECVDGVCIPASDDDDDDNDDGGLYMRCKKDADCNEGLICKYGFCVEAPQQGNDDDATDDDDITDDDDDIVIDDDDDTTPGKGKECDPCGSKADCDPKLDCIIIPMIEEGVCASDMQRAAQCFLNPDDDDDNDDDIGLPRCSPCANRNQCAGGLDCVTIPYVNQQLCAADLMDAAQCFMGGGDDGGTPDAGVEDPCPVGECTEIQGYEFCLENGQPPRNTPRCDMNNPSCPEDGQVPVQAQTQDGQAVCICLYDCSGYSGGGGGGTDAGGGTGAARCSACRAKADCASGLDCVNVPIVNQQICATDLMDAAQCFMGGGGGGEPTCKAECANCSSASECCSGLDCVSVPLVNQQICATDLMGAAQCFLGGGGAGSECSSCTSNADCNAGLSCHSNPLGGGSVCAADAMAAIQCGLGGGGGGGLRSCSSDADCIPFLEKCTFGFCIPQTGGGFP